MPKRIADFEEKARFVVEAIKRMGGKIDYETLFRQIKELRVWRTNPSEAIPSALAGMAKEGMVFFLDRNGRNVTDSVLELPDDKKRKVIRAENVTVQLNLGNKYVEDVIRAFGVFEVPEYINRGYYDFIASADILASRLGSIAAMWKRAIVVEVTGYRLWMCIRRGSAKEVRFFYVRNDDTIPVPRLSDLVERSLHRALEFGLEGARIPARIHFYSEVPYNSGFIISSAAAALLAVGMSYLKNGEHFKEAAMGSKCITGSEKFLDRDEVLERAIAIADSLYVDKSPIPSATSTSAEYLLLFGTPKPATVICYRNRGEKIKPELYPYHFEKPLFTDIWTGPGHDFPEMLRSIKRRSERLPDAEKFFEKIADDMHASVWGCGREGLDLIQRGLAKGKGSEELARGFELLKIAIYEQICNSLRFTYEYISYPHIATLTQILAQHGKYGSPVGVGGGGFFQLLNENFREDNEFVNLLLEVCREWCMYHGGRIVRDMPYVLPKKEDRFLWGIIFHKVA